MASHIRPRCKRKYHDTDLYLKFWYFVNCVFFNYFDFFEMLKNRYPNHLLRIEAEEENERAVSVYKKAGFQILPYLELYKE